MDISLGLPTDRFCVTGCTEVRFCIDTELVSAIYQYEKDDIESYPDEEPWVVTEIVRDAIVAHLRAAGRLPKPYV